MESTINDYYLKFSDEADFQENMPENMKSPAGDNFATDIIGVIYRDATYDEEGEMLTPPIATEGFHVNLRMVNAVLPAALEPYSIEAPTNPKRVWA